MNAIQQFNYIVLDSNSINSNTIIITLHQGTYSLN